MEYLDALESGIKGRLEALPKLEDAAAAGEIAVRSMHCLVGHLVAARRTICLAPQHQCNALTHGTVADVA